MRCGLDTLVEVIGGSRGIEFLRFSCFPHECGLLVTDGESSWARIASRFDNLFKLHVT